MRDEALRHLPRLPPGRSCHLLVCRPASHSLLRSQLSNCRKGQAPGGLHLCLHFGPSAFAKPDSLAGLPSQPSRPQMWAKPGPGRGRHAGHWFSFASPPLLCPTGWPVSPRDCLLSAQPDQSPLGCWTQGPALAHPSPFILPQGRLSGPLTVESSGWLWGTVG